MKAWRRDMTNTNRVRSKQDKRKVRIKWQQRIIKIYTQPPLICRQYWQHHVHWQANSTIHENLLCITSHSTLWETMKVSVMFGMKHREKRGAQEIATCIMKNTSSVCASVPSTSEITYYSDKCSGQNRNQFVAGSYLFSMDQFQNLQRINHKFLESGHSYMECDSIHSTIETAKKKTSVYMPSQWNTLISLARRIKPYHVVPMKHSDVYDFKAFVNQFCPNLKTASNGKRVNWMKICWIQTRRESPHCLYVNKTFEVSRFQEITVQSSTRKRGRPQAYPEELASC